MNKKIALYFNKHFLQAAVNPFEGKFDLLRKEGYSLYFLSHDGQISFGNYKEDFQKGDGNILGDFYRAILSGKTYQEFGYEKGYIELLEPILKDIRSRFGQLLGGLTNTEIGVRERLPLLTCFSDDIEPIVQTKIKKYLSDHFFDLDQQTNLSPSEYLTLLKLREGEFIPNSHYGIVEALSENMVMSIVKVDSEGKVNRIATSNYENYGNDTRIGAIAKYAVDEANTHLHVLSDTQREEEYGKKILKAQKWNNKLIQSKRPYISVMVELSASPGLEVPVNLIKSKIDVLTRNRSRHIGILFYRLVEEQEVSLRKIVILGDSLVNEQLLDSFERFRREDIIPLRSSHIADILHGMLLEKRAPGLGQSTHNPSREMIESIHLTPGDKVIIRWGRPTREIVAYYEGQNTYMIVKSKNAQVIEGDRFESQIFTLNRKVVLKKVFRTSKNRPLGQYQSSGPITYLGLE